MPEMALSASTKWDMMAVLGVSLEKPPLRGGGNLSLVVPSSEPMSLSTVVMLWVACKVATIISGMVWVSARSPTTDSASALLKSATARWAYKPPRRLVSSLYWGAVKHIGGSADMRLTSSLDARRAMESCSLRREAVEVRWAVADDCDGGGGYTSGSFFRDAAVGVGGKSVKREEGRSR